MHEHRGRRPLAGRASARIHPAPPRRAAAPGQHVLAHAPRTRRPRASSSPSSSGASSSSGSPSGSPGSGCHSHGGSTAGCASTTVGSSDAEARSGRRGRRRSIEPLAQLAGHGPACVAALALARSQPRACSASTDATAAGSGPPLSSPRGRQSRRLSARFRVRRRTASPSRCEPGCCRPSAPARRRARSAPPRSRTSDREPGRSPARRTAWAASPAGCPT